jgi:HD-GYP domain-containing protein (c-di-GMP phosphodiesterase class II)
MTTTRPYRAALPVEEARRRLVEAAGSQFDPAIVDVCIRVLDAPDEPAAEADPAPTPGDAAPKPGDAARR